MFATNGHYVKLGSVKVWLCYYRCIIQKWICQRFDFIMDWEGMSCKGENSRDFSFLPKLNFTFLWIKWRFKICEEWTILQHGVMALTKAKVHFLKCFALCAIETIFYALLYMFIRHWVGAGSDIPNRFWELGPEGWNSNIKCWSYWFIPIFWFNLMDNFWLTCHKQLCKHRNKDYKH